MPKKPTQAERKLLGNNTSRVNRAKIAVETKPPFTSVPDEVERMKPYGKCVGDDLKTIPFLIEMAKRSGYDEMCDLKHGSTEIVIDLRKGAAKAVVRPFLNFARQVKYCGLKTMMFLVRIINFQDTNETHANMLMINNQNKEYERFEPHGGIGYPGIDEAIERYMEKHLKHYKYVPTVDYCPMAGPQAIQSQAHYDCGSQVAGFCVVFSTLYAHLRMLNPLYSRSEVVEQINLLDEDGKFLRRYLTYIHSVISVQAGRSSNFITPSMETQTSHKTDNSWKSMALTKEDLVFLIDLWDQRLIFRRCETEGVLTTYQVDTKEKGTKVRDLVHGTDPCGGAFFLVKFINEFHDSIFVLVTTYGYREIQVFDIFGTGTLPKTSPACVLLDKVNESVDFSVGLHESVRLITPDFALITPPSRGTLLLKDKSTYATACQALYIELRLLNPQFEIYPFNEKAHKLFQDAAFMNEYTRYLFATIANAGGSNLVRAQSTKSTVKNH